jgi:hypothetical protein
MYRKNTASQFIGFQLNSATTGAGVAGATVGVNLCIDAAGAYSAGGGTVTSLGSGGYVYALAQADTNGNDITIQFAATGCITVEKTILTTACNPSVATNFGMTALPATAATTNASLLTSGTGTDQISVSAGKLLLQATQTGVTIPTVTAVGTLTTYTGNTVQTGDSFARLGAPSGASIDADILTRLATSGYTAPPTAAANATAVWTDATAGDFTVNGSPGQTITQLDGTFTTGSSSIFSTASLANAPTGGTAPTVAAIVAGMATAPVGSVANSVGQTGDSFARLGAPSGASIDADILSRLATSSYGAAPTTAAIAAAIAAGSVGSVTGAVGSVTAGVTVATNGDKTGYSLTVAPPTVAAIVAGMASAPVGSVTAPVTAGTVSDKAGYSLGAAGLNAIPITPTAGQAATFPAMLVALYRRFFKASAKSVPSLTIEQFADDGVTVLVTQRFSDDGLGNETLGAGS